MSSSSAAREEQSASRSRCRQAECCCIKVHTVIAAGLAQSQQHSSKRERVLVAAHRLRASAHTCVAQCLCRS